MLFFGAETWLLSMLTDKRLVGVHMGVLQQVMGESSKRSLDGTWRQEGSDIVLKDAGKQAVRMYIGRIKVTVAQ